MLSPEERARVLLEASPDSWVALSNDESRVVATGETFADVVARAEQNGECDPIIIKTPKEWLPLVL